MKKILITILVVVILAGILIVGSIFLSHSTESVTPEDLTKIFPPLESGITGVVLYTDKPFVTTVEVIGFSTVETDKDGVYKVMLPPGEYTIQAVGGNPFPQCMSEDIVIEPGVMQEVNLSCDTGIR